MIEKDDWRLLVIDDPARLKNIYINPTDGEEISQNAPHLKSCSFCLDSVNDNIHQKWFVTEDLSDCICKECYSNFKDMFQWELLDGWDIEWFVKCPHCGGKLEHTPYEQDYIYVCKKCNVLYSENLDDELHLPSEKT